MKILAEQLGGPVLVTEENNVVLATSEVNRVLVTTESLRSVVTPGQYATVDALAASVDLLDGIMYEVSDPYDSWSWIHNAQGDQGTADVGIIRASASGGTIERLFLETDLYANWYGVRRFSDPLHNATNNSVAIQSLINACARTGLNPQFVRGHVQHDTTIYYKYDATLNPGYPQEVRRYGRMFIRGTGYLQFDDFSNNEYDKRGTTLEYTGTTGRGHEADFQDGPWPIRELRWEKLTIIANVSDFALFCRGVTSGSGLDQVSIFNKAKNCYCMLWQTSWLAQFGKVLMECNGRTSATEDEYSVCAIIRAAEDEGLSGGMLIAEDVTLRGGWKQLELGMVYDSYRLSTIETDALSFKGNRAFEFIAGTEFVVNDPSNDQAASFESVGDSVYTIGTNETRIVVATPTTGFTTAAYIKAEVKQLANVRFKSIQFRGTSLNGNVGWIGADIGVGVTAVHLGNMHEEQNSYVGMWIRGGAGPVTVQDLYSYGVRAGKANIVLGDSETYQGADKLSKGVTILGGQMSVRQRGILIESSSNSNSTKLGATQILPVITPGLAITAVDQGTRTLTVENRSYAIDIYLTAGDLIRRRGSAGDDGEYVVESVVWGALSATVVLEEAINTAAIDGLLYRGRGVEGGGSKYQGLVADPIVFSPNLADAFYMMTRSELVVRPGYVYTGNRQAWGFAGSGIASANILEAGSAIGSVVRINGTVDIHEINLSDVDFDNDEMATGFFLLLRNGEALTYKHNTPAPVDSTGRTIRFIADQDLVAAANTTLVVVYENGQWREWTPWRSGLPIADLAASPSVEQISTAFNTLLATLRTTRQIKT